MRGRLNRPLVLAVAVVFVLVAIVAVASTGSTPGGSGDTRKPHETILDTFFSLALIALIPAAAIFIYGLMQRKEIAEEMASGRYRRTSTIGLVVFLALFTGAVYLVREHGSPLQWGDLGESVDIGPNGEVVVRDASESDPNAYRAEFAWVPVLLILGLIAAAVAAFTFGSRRRQQALGDDLGLVAEQLADVLDETLDDLRAEPDPRRAVIAAYARLERSFAAAGLPRREQETAVEYVPRALEGLEVDAAAVRKLTDLFTTAKFSQHPIDDSMKLEAVSSLERIRDDLRAAAARAPEPPSEPAQPGQAATS
jgi:Domain of unknown function (DUF4129)